MKSNSYWPKACFDELACRVFVTLMIFNNAVHKQHKALGRELLHFAQRIGPDLAIILAQILYSLLG